MWTFLFSMEATTMFFFPDVEGSFSGSDVANSCNRDEIKDSGEEWNEKD